MKNAWSFRSYKPLGLRSYPDSNRHFRHAWWTTANSTPTSRLSSE